MRSEAQNKRLISYALGIFFLCSVVSFSLLSFKLVSMYNENRDLKERMDRIVQDYDEIDNDGNGKYIKINQDEDIDINQGKVIVSFPNIK